MSGRAYDEMLATRDAEIDDLRAENRAMHGQLARHQLEVEKLRARCLTVAAGHVICRRCLSDGERSMVEDNLRRMLWEKTGECQQLRDLLADRLAMQQQQQQQQQ